MASLQLAEEISDRQQARILVIGKDANKKNDRTWCFWTKETMEYDGIVSSSWSRCQSISRNHKIIEKKMAPYAYRQIRSKAFYDNVLDVMLREPQVAMDLFTKLFQKLSPEAFFRFLDDDMGFQELIGIYLKAPILRFTRYALRSLVRKNV